VKVFYARIGFGDRIVAAANQTEALKLLGLKRSQKEAVRFREWKRLDGYRPWSDALKSPGVVFGKLATTSDRWKRKV